MVSSLARRSCASVVAVFAALAALPGYGYSLENKSWPNGTVITVQMELGAPSQILQDGSRTWNEAALPAIDAWNAEMHDIRLAVVMDSTMAVSSGDDVNSASFSSTVFGDSFGSGVLAVTYYRTQGNTFKEADILFNKAQLFDSYRGNLQFNSQGKCNCDIQRVFLHELGHALGLNHPDSAGQNVDAIMNSVVGNFSQLTADDEAGIQVLYGAPTPTTSGRLVNISTRMRVGAGNEVLIGGFIIQGDVVKTVILRAIGPSLSNSGLTGALQDPQMELYDSAGTLLENNDNWQQSLDMSEIIDSGLAPSDPREAAIFARLAPGNYTAIISGVNGTTGIGLVENYTLDTNASHAANISTRGRVGVGNEVLIGGFIVGGDTTKRILVRAIGPSLGGNGFSVLTDPVVELHGSDGPLIALNDDWATGAQRGEIAATGLQPGNSLESALIVTIPSGNYTAIVRGADGGAGIGLVEIYDLDE